MDSPGFSAQYCTYTLMEHETKDILASIIIDKRMTSLKSTAMELEGLRRGLKIIQDSGVLIGELVTDASTSVAAMMSKELFLKPSNDFIEMEKTRLCYSYNFGVIFLRIMNCQHG